ncbi:Scavenger mRNA decapping enzyme C-term binding [Carpediemonas membranifera]|uniref:Scavenger mRNA decapping enzyme C-term binding n=1 Tax=Carpediemonas membranifera TaxID=201153 RepID=A0A8J6BWZ8_9EUKA|nr:Scavenger mRNA decapping enzyme C-term binding [Carpediemonas membranifera]|eukprot:KAG9392931.1 Scavenger mRNA decapping enzyme C-term binding [Carpediemonas membranifera]
MSLLTFDSTADTIIFHRRLIQTHFGHNGKPMTDYSHHWTLAEKKPHEYVYIRNNKDFVSKLIISDGFSLNHLDTVLAQAPLYASFEPYGVMTPQPVPSLDALSAILHRFDSALLALTGSGSKFTGPPVISQVEPVKDSIDVELEADEPVEDPMSTLEPVDDPNVAPHLAALFAVDPRVHPAEVGDWCSLAETKQDLLCATVPYMATLPPLPENFPDGLQSEGAWLAEGAVILNLTSDDDLILLSTVDMVHLVALPTSFPEGPLASLRGLEGRHVRWLEELQERIKVSLTRAELDPTEYKLLVPYPPPVWALHVHIVPASMRFPPVCGTFFPLASILSILKKSPSYLSTATLNFTLPVGHSLAVFRRALDDDQTPSHRNEDLHFSMRLQPQDLASSRTLPQRASSHATFPQPRHSPPRQRPASDTARATHADTPGPTERPSQPSRLDRSTRTDTPEHSRAPISQSSLSHRRQSDISPAPVPARAETRQDQKPALRHAMPAPTPGMDQISVGGHIGAAQVTQTVVVPRIESSPATNLTEPVRAKPPRMRSVASSNIGEKSTITTASRVGGALPTPESARPASVRPDSSSRMKPARSVQAMSMGVSLGAQSPREAPMPPAELVDRGRETGGRTPLPPSRLLEKAIVGIAEDPL